MPEGTLNWQQTLLCRNFDGVALRTPSFKNGSRESVEAIKGRNPPLADQIRLCALGGATERKDMARQFVGIEPFMAAIVADVINRSSAVSSDDAGGLAVPFTPWTGRIVTIDL